MEIVFDIDGRQGEVDSRMEKTSNDRITIEKIESRTDA